MRSLETQTLSQNIEPAKRASRKHASALMGKVASPREASLRWRRQRLRRIRSRHAPMQGHNQRPRARRARSAPGGPAAYTDFRFESREGSAPTRRGERRAGTGPRRDGLGARHDQLTNAAAGVKQVASPFNSSVCPVLSSTYRPRSGRASHPIGVARSRQRTSESQSIESSQRPCARPPTCSQDHIRTENLLINVIGRKDLRSVTKIPQE